MEIDWGFPSFWRFLLVPTRARKVSGRARGSQTLWFSLRQGSVLLVPPRRLCTKRFRLNQMPKTTRHLSREYVGAIKKREFSESNSTTIISLVAVSRSFRCFRKSLNQYELDSSASSSQELTRDGARRGDWLAVPPSVTTLLPPNALFCSCDSRARDLDRGNSSSLLLVPIRTLCL